MGWSGCCCLRLAQCGLALLGLLRLESLPNIRISDRFGQRDLVIGIANARGIGGRFAIAKRHHQLARIATTGSGGGNAGSLISGHKGIGRFLIIGGLLEPLQGRPFGGQQLLLQELIVGLL